MRAGIPQLLQARMMPRSPPCLSQWSSLWLASLATLVVHSALSYSYSSSSPSAYQRPATAGKRPGFMERTLILLDVNTRSPIRVLNDNFLSLQLDPSIIKDGWLDFLRYPELLVTIHCLNVRWFLYKPRCVHLSWKEYTEDVLLVLVTVCSVVRGCQSERPIQNIQII